MAASVIAVVLYGFIAGLASDAGSGGVMGTLLGFAAKHLFDSAQSQKTSTNKIFKCWSLQYFLLQKHNEITVPLKDATGKIVGQAVLQMKSLQNENEDMGTVKSIKLDGYKGTLKK